MLKIRTLAGAALLSTLAAMPVASAPALAHHSVQSEYGGGIGPTETLTGKVTKIRWSNPHIEIYVDVTGGQVPAGQWIVNSHAPGLLARGYGIMQKDVKIGDTVEIIGWRSQQNVPRFHMRAISVNGGPLRSTHRASDIKQLKDGNLGKVVPAPNVDKDSENEYNANIGGQGAAVSAADEESATSAPADAEASQQAEGSQSGFIWWASAGTVALALIGFFLLRRRSVK